MLEEKCDGEKSWSRNSCGFLSEGGAQSGTVRPADRKHVRMPRPRAPDRYVSAYVVGRGRLAVAGVTEMRALVDSRLYTVIHIYPRLRCIYPPLCYPSLASTLSSSLVSIARLATDTKTLLYLHAYTRTGFGQILT